MTFDDITEDGRLRTRKSETPTKWKEEAILRKNNQKWLAYSQEIAMLLHDKMEEMDLTQSALAYRMDCSQQYISKILKGKENLSLETISRLEEAIGSKILNVSL